MKNVITLDDNSLGEVLDICDLKVRIPKKPKVKKDILFSNKKKADQRVSFL